MVPTSLGKYINKHFLKKVLYLAGESYSASRTRVLERRETTGVRLGAYILKFFLSSLKTIDFTDRFVGGWG